MKKITIIILLITLLTSLFSLNSNAKKKNIMWEVKKGKNVVYLVGSVHALKKEMYPLSKRIEEAFDSSDCLIVEADVTAVNPFELQKIIFAKGKYEEGKTLKTELPEDLYTKLEKFVASTGMMTLNQIETFKPWYITLILTQITMTKLGLQADAGVDVYFLNRAKGKKEIIELESFDFQINLLARFTDQEQIAILKNGIEEADNMEKTLNDMLVAWQSGDSDKLNELTREKMKAEPKLRKYYMKLFPERDKKMVKKIIEFLNQKNVDKKYFLVVGAGHLLGNDGVIAILKNKGFEVTKK